MRLVTCDADFRALVCGTRPLVVDFTATWCGPCQAIAPTFEALSDEFKEELDFCKVDVDKCEEAAEGVTSIPMFQVWRGGKVVATLVGSDEKRLRRLVEQAAS